MKRNSITEKDEIAIANLFARGYKFADISTILNRKYQNILDHIKKPKYPTARDIIVACGRPFDDGYTRQTKKAPAEPEAPKQEEPKQEEPKKVVQEKLVKGSIDYLEDIGNGVRIRKLTPRECWRLMGFDDEDFDKAAKVCSDTRLYSQAGNSIVVNVLEAIFKQMIKE